ncbi:MAG: hypothetical protein C0501_00165 [Isosphaera sp.]|nr:hypothetical protein [Isosphaera sp.]
MLMSLSLSLALAAPVPAGTAPNPTGPVPRLVEVKAEGGKVTVPVTRAENQPAGNVVVNGNVNGARIVVRNEVQKAVPVELSEVKELKVYAADGKEVAVADAVKKLAAGGTVVVSADGQKVDPRHLKLFRDDVLVLVSPELAAAPPAVMAGPFNAVPGVQFQIVPAQILPAVPVQPPIEK